MGSAVKLACIVLAHRGPAQLALMLSKLRHPRVRVYLHVDQQVPNEAFLRELRLTGVDDVVLLPRFASRWGHIEIIDATLAGISRALADGCDYFVLLSGQDFPLRPAEEMLDFFAEAGQRSYMEYFPFPVEHWRLDGRLRTDFYTYTVRGRRETYIPLGEDVSMSWKGRILNEFLHLRSVLKPPRKFPSYLTPFGGSQWWNLSRAAAAFLSRFLDEHPDYRAYHEHTLLPDEMFFQSILLGSGFSDSFEVVNDSLRFMEWDEGSSHPRILGIDDLSAIRSSGKMFARKFDDSEDRTVLERISDGLGGHDSEPPPTDPEDSNLRGVG